MFLNLFLKEIKGLFKSITFYIFIFVVLLFYISQLPVPRDIKSIEPQPGARSYGNVKITDITEEMQTLYNQMSFDYNNGSIMKYGFINKYVTLSQNEKNEIKSAMDRIGSHEEGMRLDIKVSYDEYLKILRELDKRLGGGTEYGDKYREMAAVRPKTYEEARLEFDKILREDNITGAAGRETADYLGITAGFFPIFLSTFVLMKDKRYKMHELIGSRKVSSFAYIFSKYFAIVLGAMIVYILIATYATFTYWKIANEISYTIDFLGFYRYIFGWILPTVMFTTSLGMLVSLVFGNGIVAIPMQFILWMSSLLPLYGDYNFTKFIIRFNTFGATSEYNSWFIDILINRLFFSALSIVIVATVALIWSRKRGSLNGIFGKGIKPYKVQL